MMTHVEFAAAVAGLDCTNCGRATMRDAVLVNEHGLVLLRGRSCTRCGHRRHRSSIRKARNTEAASVTAAAVPLPRLSA
jgi:hypothetical protein